MLEKYFSASPHSFLPAQYVFLCQKSSDSEMYLPGVHFSVTCTYQWDGTVITEPILNFFHWQDHFRIKSLSHNWYKSPPCCAFWHLWIIKEAWNCYFCKFFLFFSYLICPAGFGLAKLCYWREEKIGPIYFIILKDFFLLEGMGKSLWWEIQQLHCTAGFRTCRNCTI